MSSEIENVIVEITNKCNLNCMHCFNLGCRPGEMHIDVLETVIRRCVEARVKEVAFSGGEPLLYSHIDRVIDLVKANPKIKFGFLTNGHLINEKLMAEMDGIDNIYIQVSVDGSTKEIYERSRGKDTFDQLVRGLEILETINVKDKRSRTALTKINYKQVEDICRFSWKYKLAPSFLFVAALGNAEDNWTELGLSIQQKMVVNYEIENINVKYGTKLRAISPTGACGFSYGLPRKTFNVKIAGDVFTCDYYYDYTIGNLIDESFDEIIHGEKIKKIYQMCENRRRIMESNVTCMKCDVYSECRFGCPGEARKCGSLQDAQCTYRKIYYGCAVNNIGTK